jgi:hypothetical protein
MWHSYVRLLYGVPLIPNLLCFAAEGMGTPRSYTSSRVSALCGVKSLQSIPLSHHTETVGFLPVSHVHCLILYGLTPEALRDGVRCGTDQLEPAAYPH